MRCHCEMAHNDEVAQRPFNRALQTLKLLPISSVGYKDGSENRKMTFNTDVAATLQVAYPLRGNPLIDRACSACSRRFT